MLRQLLTGLMLLTTLATHAQCIHVHHSDGWTEEITIETIDNITFTDTTTLLAPTVKLSNGLTKSVATERDSPYLYAPDAGSRCN